MQSECTPNMRVNVVLSGTLFVEIIIVYLFKIQNCMLISIVDKLQQSI